MVRAPVGDRYVLEQMQKLNAALGGEQSGHILLPHLATTGDGLLTALVVLDLIARTGQTIDQLTADLKVFPQVIVNIKVREKKPLESIPSVAAAIRAAEEELKDSGRVVIRYSGTEPLARVMIEAESEAAMHRHANSIADAIRAELGAG
jgi:phosphoglucosamine mutase